MVRLVLRLIVLIFRLTIFGAQYIAARVLRYLNFPLTRQFYLRQPSKLRELFESLGGVFIKFGQWIAMRPDFVPEIYCKELRQLLDDVPSFPNHVAEHILEKELGKPLSMLFDGQLNNPVASASFAQVYKLRLKNGRYVAVKVQRPNMKRIVRCDLSVLKMFVWIADFTTMSYPTKLDPMFREFSRWTDEELNYIVEARYAERIRRNSINSPLSGTNFEVYPQIYWNLTTSRVLTMDFIDGYWLKDLLNDQMDSSAIADRKLSEQGIDRSVVSRRLFRMWLNQVFVGQVYHADPHAGNILLLPGNRIGMVDFGITGLMTDRLRNHMVSMLTSLSQGNTEQTFHAATGMLNVTSKTDVESFQNEYENNLNQWINVVGDPRATLTEKSFASLLVKNLGIVRKYGLSLTPNVLLYYRSIITIDTMLLQLDESFNLNEEIREFFREFILNQIRNKFTVDNYVVALSSYQDFILSFPREMESLFRRLNAITGRVLTLGERLKSFGASFLRKSAYVVAGLVLAVWALEGRDVYLARWLVVKLPWHWYNYAALALGSWAILRWAARKLGS